MSKNKTYAFLSVSNEKTGVNLGVCIIEWDKKWGKASPITGAILKARDLKLITIEEYRDYKLFELNQEEFEAQGLELNRFYSREEMLSAGFEKL